MNYVSFTLAVVDKSQQSYQEALDKAKDKLPPTHPIRLGLALNFSVCFFTLIPLLLSHFPVFYYEILETPDKACQLAKQVFIKPQLIGLRTYLGFR
jgi:hypothetical protein